MTSLAYVNGMVLPLAEAQVSVLDRGFLFADGIYEVAAVLEGRLVDSAAHLARLERSCNEIGLSLPLPLDAIEAVQRDLVARNALAEGLVYLQVTRGADTGRDFLSSPGLGPTLVLFTTAKRIVASPAARLGISIATVPDLRWARRDIKSVALLAQVLAKRESQAAGCDDAWMVDSEGYVTEGASATAFILTKDNVLVTRPNSQAVLPGCTGAAVAALAVETGATIERRAFTVAELLAAREAFHTSASTFVMPVVRVDGQIIGDGTPGPVATRLRELYVDFARKTAV
ncbi:D-amino-acid transaminase [Sphingobium algorifonticola]|uniref:Probable branched-chain-amino-acid aminotransferase n=1 Tax=Sphingobium algorifonticola TaxID=2008318 RepID=A0A437JDH6_9SPHN|nr:D-amino-acid transaminase [Sphingobium algorifonticola]RVT43941.1 D-amino-acid transaminase [Sphingobium algorifonticola]